MSHEHQHRSVQEGEPIFNDQAASQTYAPSVDGDHAAIDRIWASKGSGDAITPILHGLDTRLTQRLAALDIEHDTGEHRANVVAEASQDLHDASTVLVPLFDGVAATQRKRYKPALDRVALSLDRLLQFVRMRSPHKDLEQRLMIGVTAFDGVLGRLGMPALEARETPVMTMRATHTAALELSGVQNATGSVRAALHNLEEEQRNGVDAFFELAKAADNEEPSFMESFLRALVGAALVELSEVAVAAALAEAASHGASVTENAVASVGHAGSAERIAAGVPTGSAGHAVAGAARAGGEAARAAEHLSDHGGHHLRDEMITKMFYATSDSLVDVAKEEHDEHHEAETSARAEEPSKVDGKLRALVFFKSQLKSQLAHRFSRYSRSLDKMISESSAGESDLNEMAATLNAVAMKTREPCKVRAACLWASYCAQSRLGTHYAGNTKVSKMEDYFGKRADDGRQYGTARAGGDGVLSISLYLAEPGQRPTLEKDGTRIIGLNSLIQNLVLADAGHMLSRVNLPKEVHVRYRFAHAVIALDETNRIRDVLDWAPIEHDLGQNACEFWKQWGSGLEVG